MSGDARIDSREATPGDIEWLLDLRVTTMFPHYEAAGRNLTLEEQKARLVQDYDAIRILRAEGREIGMMKVVRKPDEWKLVQIQLLPECQGAGIGTRLVRELVEEAGSEGVPLRLEVLKVNPARRIYERLGFRVERENEHSFYMCIGGGSADNT